MTIFDQTLKAGSLAGCLLIASCTGTAWAHSSGGTSSSHSTGSATSARSTLSHGMSAPGMTSSAHKRSTATSATGAMSAPSSPEAAAENSAPSAANTLAAATATIVGLCGGSEVAANCAATLRSRFDASGGDPNTIVITPAPTVIPPTRPAPPIVEPNVQTGLPTEQSGGSSPPLTVRGGGPTLADCMSLWDPEVHMTKASWKSTCIRTTNGMDMPDDGLGLNKPAHAQRSANNREE